MKENGTEISTNFYRVHNYNFKREREREIGYTNESVGKIGIKL